MDMSSQCWFPRSEEPNLANLCTVTGDDVLELGAERPENISNISHLDISFFLLIFPYV